MWHGELLKAVWDLKSFINGFIIVCIYYRPYSTLFFIGDSEASTDEAGSLHIVDVER